jgi:hypothetical protein
MRAKAYTAVLLMLLGGAAARAEPSDCAHLKSSHEPYELLRMTIVNNGRHDAESLSVSREPSGRSVVTARRVGNSSQTKTISQGLFVMEQDSSAGGGASKMEYSGVDIRKFPLDRPATYTMTQTFANGQKVSFKVEYKFIGRATTALGRCRLDIVRYSSRRFNIADGQETSFLEGEYSPELQVTLNSKSRVTAQGQGMSVIVAARHARVGTNIFPLIGGARWEAAARSPQPTDLQPNGQAPQEFSVGSIWEYRQQAMAPGRIFAHGQADIVDASGAQIGGVGFYCAVPHSYVDIYVRKPGAGLGNYLWGNATLKTSLKLNGVSMPAKVEGGIVFIDIDDAVRPVLIKALELGAGAGSQRIDVDVANFAKFALIMKTNKPPSPSPPAVAVSYARMVSMCDATIAQQRKAQ